MEVTAQLFDTILSTITCSCLGVVSCQKRE
jgi:hypothetical protein